MNCRASGFMSANSLAGWPATMMATSIDLSTVSLASASSLLRYCALAGRHRLAEHQLVERSRGERRAAAERADVDASCP